jgi:hypothetical protein
MGKSGPFCKFPVFKRRERATTYTATQITNTPQPFGWFRGLTILTFNDNTSNFNWTIQLTGGQAGHSAEPGSWVSYVAGTGFDYVNTPLTVTIPVQPTTVDTIIVTTSEPRTYHITFSPYITVSPTIEKTAGADFTTTATLTSIAYVSNVYGIA